MTDILQHLKFFAESTSFCHSLNVVREFWNFNFRRRLNCATKHQSRNFVTNYY